MLKKQELAGRLGISKSAISLALDRGRLIEEADGTISTDRPENRPYLARFTAHRGKRRTEPASPGRAEAQRRRAASAYARGFQRLAARIAGTAPALPVHAAVESLRSSLAGALPKIAARVDLNDIERSLERELSGAIHQAKTAGAEAITAAMMEEPRTAAPLPPTAEDEPLDTIRELIDLLHSLRLDLETEMGAGFVITREAALRKFSRLDEELAILRQLPRRVSALVAAAFQTGGDASARAVLRGALTAEAERLRKRN